MKADRDLQALVYENLNMSRKCSLMAQRAHCILGCTKQHGQQVKKDSAPIFHAGETVPAVLWPALEHEKDTDLLEHLQRRATKLSES